MKDRGAIRQPRSRVPPQGRFSLKYISNLGTCRSYGTRRMVMSCSAVRSGHCHCPDNARGGLGFLCARRKALDSRPWPGSLSGSPRRANQSGEKLPVGPPSNEPLQLGVSTLAGSLFGKARIGLQYALTRSGPMSMAPSQLGAFTRSSPDRAHANLEYHVQPLSLDAFGEGLHPFPAVTASVCNLNPTSRGSVLIRSNRFDEAPIIAPNYLSTKEDQTIAAHSLRQVRAILAQPTLAKYNPEEWKPGAQFQSDEELTKLAGDIATTIFHPVGTAKMGRQDDPGAIVDRHLRVRGIKGLRVVDASIMPEITSGNTNAPTLMIAEKAARWIRNGV